MIFIIDASVAIKWFVDEPDRPSARAWLDSDHQLVAPDFLRVEVANIAWKKTLRGEIAHAQASAILMALDEVFDWFEAANRHLRPAFELAATLRHPVYDCLYLACADALGSRVVTADRRLIDIAEKAGQGSLVQAVDEIPPAATQAPLKVGPADLMSSVDDIERLAAMVDGIDADFPGMGGTRTASSHLEGQDFMTASPAYRRLAALLDSLSPSDRLALLTTVQLGIVPGQPLGRAESNAVALMSNPDMNLTDYLARYATLLGVGLATLVDGLNARPSEK